MCNTCGYARGDQFDDSRGASLGTDCQDCGRVGADNFTAVDDDALLQWSNLTTNFQPGFFHNV